jgi:hypothetical protein
MVIVLIAICALFLLGIVVLIFIAIRKDELKATLASLISILTGLIASQYAPEIEGKANIDLHFGALGTISGEVMKVNSARPVGIWYASYLLVGVLIAITLFMIYSRSSSTASAVEP